MKKTKYRKKENLRGRIIIKLFPPGLFVRLCKEYNVDYKAKKLTGEVLVLTIIEVLLSGVSFSLRNLANQYNNPDFQRKVLKRKEYTTIHRTSFSHRFKKINPLFFCLYRHVFIQVNYVKYQYTKRFRTPFRLLGIRF